MGKQVKITCDSCDTDITYAGVDGQFRLHLQSELIPSDLDIVSLGIRRHQVTEPKYFCDLRCLNDWLTRYYGKGK